MRVAVGRDGRKPLHSGTLSGLSLSSTQAIVRRNLSGATPLWSGSSAELGALGAVLPSSTWLPGVTPLIAA